MAATTSNMETPHMRTASRRQAGMTLPEVLLAVMIFGIIVVAALMIYDRSNRMFKTGVENADVQQTTRIAFEKLLSEVRMAGFDYDRDGAPSGGEQQPDEQIEFAGVGAITFRGNLDYFTDLTNQHGLEPGYATADKFETVTTGNDEIVTYALKSTSNPAANVQQIKFYADVAVPRAAYTGGSAETLVTIGEASSGRGYDLCDDADGCDDPPYTLYRITLDRAGNPTEPVPVAENIRSLTFRYFTAQDGSTLATVAESGASQQRIDNGAVGGLGLYDPADVGADPNYEHRAHRGEIRAIRMRLTGMSAQPVAGFSNVEETLARWKNYRTFGVETTIIPRNLGFSGSEDPHLGPPEPPDVQSVCSGHCAVTRVTWSPSPGGAPVDNYYVCYDENTSGSYANCIDAALNLESDVPNLVPGRTYSFKVKARNSEGQTLSENYITKTILNRTQPTAPDNFTGTATGNGVELTWDRPDTNTETWDELSCQGGGSTDGSRVSSAEKLYYWLYRSTNPNFTPGGADSALIASSASLDDQSPRVAFLDNVEHMPTGVRGPANCTNYYYRVQTRDFCASTPEWNENDDPTIGESPEFAPPLGDPAIGPYSIMPATLATPARPITLSVDMANSECDNATNLCRIKLDWSEVVTDTDGNGIAIDTYRIKRWRDAGGTRSEYPIDPDQPDGFLVSGALLNGPTWTDSEDTSVTAPAEDDGAGNVYVYYYTVEAMNCSEPSDPSDEARYPTCVFNDTTVAATGALAGSGMTVDDPWILANGDSIRVSNTNRTIARVVFNVVDSGGVSLPGYPFVDGTAPFEIGWADQENGEVYAVTMRVQDSNGCIQSPTLVRYVQDQAPAGCYPFIDTTTWSLETGTGANTTRTMTLNIKNASPLENMVLTAISFTYANSTACDSNANFTIDSITFGSATDGTDRAIGTHNNVAKPSGDPGIITLNSGINAAYGIAFKFNYQGNQCGDVAAANPISSICLHYTLASEPGVTKVCNVIGAGTNNPNSCN